MGLDDSLKDLLFGFIFGILPLYTTFKDSYNLVDLLNGRSCFGLWSALLYTLNLQDVLLHHWMRYGPVRWTRQELEEWRTNGLLLYRAGCEIAELAAHVINHCPLIQMMTILRHYNIVKLLLKSLRRVRLKCLNVSWGEGSTWQLHKHLITWQNLFLII